MSISAKIIADSVNPIGTRITSWILRYPRWIHSEFMTHRIFSRNAASSRAIPFKRMFQDVEEDPAIPEFWGSEQRGMQSGGELEPSSKENAMRAWDAGRKNALLAAKAAGEAGLHKSLCNRLLEPWAHITVLATATDHDNFFALRAHPAAMPEFQVLAYQMLAAYMASTPNEAEWGDWHIPKFGSMEGVLTQDIVKVATARCARLSYLTFDGNHDPAKDIELHDKLAEAGHWSPFEHCAQSNNMNARSNFDSRMPCGWEQYRKRFGSECRRNVNLTTIMATKPDWIKT